MLPKIREIQIYSNPQGIKKLSKIEIKITFKIFSKISSDAGFKVFLNAEKYPDKQADIEINGKEIAIK